MQKINVKKSIFSKIRNNFIAGVVVLIPIGITLYLTLFLIRISGRIIPKEINHRNLSESYNIPGSLNELAEKGEKGYLALKIVEIIGEDEVSNLDSETIYFISNLLNKLNLKEFRNEILATALPLRI